MDNHSDRPEIIEALKGNENHYIRKSFTLNASYIYVALPLKPDEKLIGIIRLSLPENIIRKNINELKYKILLFITFIVILSSILIYLVFMNIVHKLSIIKKGAEKFASGDFEYRLRLFRKDELGSLADSLNIMAEQLDERLKTITVQRNELEAVLSSMIEGLIAIDRDEKLIRANNSAEKLFDFNFQTAKGQKILEIIRNASLNRFIKKAIISDEENEDIISINRDGEKYIHMRSTALIGADGKNMGVLIIINDVTQIKRLEMIRTDFVANVSHELKTPITSIKGFVETLLDGAYEDKESLVRFLGIIEKHTDRLNSIVDDLLLLSKVESKKEGNYSDFETVRIESIIQNSVMLFSEKAAAKKIEIIIDTVPNVNVFCNKSLLQQALINLLDNSIKYSDSDKKIYIRSFSKDERAYLEIEDNGWGIPAEDISRVFERFYRVDKGRSRDMGGTGLGLSIVKHIVQTHNGTVILKSEPGKGSIFTINLPLINS